MIVLKKINKSIIMSGLLVSNIAAAEYQPYVFATVGHQSVYAKFDTTDSVISKNKENEGNFNIQAGAGVKKTIKNNYYFGMEANVAYMNSDVKTKNCYTDMSPSAEVSDKIHLKYSMGVYLTAGKAFDNGLEPYILLGYSLMNTDLSSSEPTVNKNISGSDRKLFGGISGGLGLNYKVTDALKLRMTGIYTVYGNKESKDFDTDSGSGEIHKFKVDMNTFNYSLGVSYNF